MRVLGEMRRESKTTAHEIVKNDYLHIPEMQGADRGWRAVRGQQKAGTMSEEQKNAFQATLVFKGYG